MQSALNRRDFLLRTAALSIAAGLPAACGRRSAVADLPVLRVSTVGKGEADIQLLQNTANIQAETFRLEYSNFASGQLVIEALDGGALDFGNMSEIPPVFAAASTIQSFRQIAVLHGDVNNQVVLVPRGSTIAALADLKGKRVGYVRATTSQYFLIRMLQSVDGSVGRARCVLQWAARRLGDLWVSDPARDGDRGRAHSENRIGISLGQLHRLGAHQRAPGSGQINIDRRVPQDLQAGIRMGRGP
jgi:hypothetical protein